MAFKGLVHDYKPAFFYFEMIDWTRKALLSAGLLAFEHGSTQQLFLGLVLSFFVFALTVRCEPFERSGHNLVRYFEETAIFLTFAVSLLLKLEPTICAANAQKLCGYDHVLLASKGVLFLGFLLDFVLAVRSLIRQKKLLISINGDVKGMWETGNLHAGLMPGLEKSDAAVDEVGNRYSTNDAESAAGIKATKQPKKQAVGGSALPSSVLRAATLMAVVAMSAASSCGSIQCDEHPVRQVRGAARRRPQHACRMWLPRTSAAGVRRPAQLAVGNRSTAAAGMSWLSNWSTAESCCCPPRSESCDRCSNCSMRIVRARARCVARDSQ